MKSKFGDCSTCGRWNALPRGKNCEGCIRKARLEKAARRAGLEVDEYILFVDFLATFLGGKA